MNIKKCNLQIIALLFLMQLVASFTVFASPPQQLITVVVTPTADNWNYKLGDRADFNIKIIKNGALLPNIIIKYEIGLEQMSVMKTGEMKLKNGNTILKGIKIKEPGFLRCKVTVDYDGKKYTSWGTAGFAPDKIEATATMPPDFDEFWKKGKAELAKMPIDAEVTLMPDLCTSKINVYHVSLQNIKMPGSWRGVSRFYGMISVPKKPGKYPAILSVPGAGIRSYGRDNRAANGVIVFAVGIHGIPVNMPYNAYLALATGALANYHLIGLDDREQYYFKRVYLGIVRSIDYIFSLAEFDGENLAVTGGSQGGGLSIVAAGLDSRVKYLAAFYPALCDFQGYLKGRAGGWPHMYKNFNEELHNSWLQTTPYYDAVNFARKLSIPTWFSWGYNDHICPPTSMHATYNVIKSPKELHLLLEAQHWTFPEQNEKADNWLFNKLIKQHKE